MRWCHKNGAWSKLEDPSALGQLSVFSGDLSKCSRVSFLLTVLLQYLLGSYTHQDENSERKLFVWMSKFLPCQLIMETEIFLRQENRKYWRMGLWARLRYQNTNTFPSLAQGRTCSGIAAAGIFTSPYICCIFSTHFP